MIKFLDQIG